MFTSMLLRLHRLPSRTERAQEVADQLRQIDGSRDIGFGPQRIRSVPDAIAWALRHALAPAPQDPAQLALPALNPETGSSGARALGDLCPECHAAAVVWQDGCRRCLACGIYSEC